MQIVARIEQQKSGHWKAIVRRARYGVRLKVKTFPRHSDAEAWARQTEAAIERGAWRETGDADRTTLREALDKYKQEVVPGMRSAKKEESVIAILRDDPLARRLMARLTSADVASMRDRWRRAGLAVGTIRRRLHTLSHVYTVARKEWGMPGLMSPTHDVALDREPAGRDRRVSNAELGAIKKAAVTPAMRNFVTLAVETAMRRGELFRATWADVDTHARTLRIPRTKNGEPRTVPLSSAAVKALKKMRGADAGGRLFPHWTSVDAVSVSFQRTVRRARKRYVQEREAAGQDPDPRFLVGIHLHDLRHEATSRLAQVPGLQVHMLARITGHKDLRMLMRYYNPTPAEVARMLP